MSTKARLVNITLPLLIVAAGVLAAVVLIGNRPQPQKVVRENTGALVETFPVNRGQRRVKVQGTGTVQPRQQVEIIPQVSGRVVEISPSLVVGGFFRQGELLFRIEPTDYHLAVDRARAGLAKAEFELATIEGQARVARQEWERFATTGKEDPNPLVLFEPQLKNARAALLAARAALGQAELDLERTSLRAPFAGIIRSEAIDLGQFVRAATPVAVLAGTADAEIIVPLPLPDIDWLQIPRPGNTEPGSPATIQLATAGRRVEWSGRIARSLGEVDPQGRMARVVVSVNDPYGLNAPGGEQPELAVGTFVQVTLHGAMLPDVAVIPATALRDDDQVWLMEQGALRTRKVEVVRRGRDEVVIGAGLQAGDQVVLTTVAGAAEGMKLRPAGGR